MTIPEIIRAQRLKKKLSQVELARAVGLDSPQFIYMMEHGRSHIPYKTLGRLIEVLDLNEAKLIRILLEDFERDLNEQITEGKIAATKELR